MNSTALTVPGLLAGGYPERDTGEIKPSHHTFILLGDTQSSSHWEFWRERTNKERKQMIDEITRREPAFVLHLGDLTTRGGFKKALAGVRPAAQRISSEEDPLYSYPGKS